MRSCFRVYWCTLRNMHRLVFKCLPKVVVHAIKFDVGHLFHAVVVLSMVELQRALGYAPSWD